MNVNAEGEWESIDDQIYDYQLIEFVTRGPKGQRKVDIVPSSWPHYNAQKGRIETQFLPPPYTAEMFQMLKQFIEEKLLPLKTWPVYTVSLVGQASKY